jgi:hypothetical protein
VTGAPSPTNVVARDVEDGDTDTDEGFDDDLGAEGVEQHEEVAASPASSPTSEPAPEPVRTEDSSTRVPEE